MPRGSKGGAPGRAPHRAVVCAAALLLAMASLPGHAAPATAGGSAATTAPAGPGLPTHAATDRLSAFLGQAVRWAGDDGAGGVSARVPLAQLRPVIVAAVQSHPEVRLAGEQRATAGFATREAQAPYLPQASLSFDGGQRNVGAVDRPWSQVPAHRDDSRSVGLTVRQLLYDFGATSRRLDAQRTRESAAEARAEARQSDLALRALAIWHEVFRVRQQRALAAVNLQSRQQTLAFIREREQLGGSSASEVLRVRARVSDAEASLVAADNRLLATEASFGETFGMAPPAQLDLPIAPPVDLALYGDAQALLRANATLVEAQALSDAAGLDARASAAALLPSLHLQANVTRRDIGGAGQAATDHAIGLVVQHNFYTGGADTARADQARQRAVEARLEVDVLRRQLDRALQQAVADVRTADALVAARADAVRVATSAYEAVREQFAFRRGTLLDLLRAQEDLYLAGRDLIDGVVDHAVARYRLLHLGSGLTPLLALAPGGRPAPP
jgi:outer membrane protein, adhesin transport system